MHQCKAKQFDINFSNSNNQFNQTYVDSLKPFQLENTENWLGLERSKCNKLLNILNIHNVSFGHWVSVPDLNLLLTFKHQICCSVAHIDLNNL